MDILNSALRRLFASIGAMGALAARLWKLLSHLVFLQERRGLEHLRNENYEIQNMLAYEKLLAQYAKLTLSLGRNPRDVDAMLSELRHARLAAYLKLNALPARDKEQVVEITPLINRRLRERRQMRDRRNH